MPGLVQPDDLRRDPQILLRLRGDPSTPLTSLQGKVGAIIHNGEFFITSPNMTRIFAPPVNEGLSVRADLRLGDDDPLQWPQSYITAFPHYGTIPWQPPHNPDSYAAVLYEKFNSSDFIPYNGTSITGLGFLCRPKQVRLKAALDRIQARLEEYQANIDIQARPPLFSTLVVCVNRLLRCLEGIPMTRKQVSFIFAETQRYLLEFIAASRYQYLYRPRMIDSKQTPPDKPVNVVGTVTVDSRVADDFFRAGLPVWLVRPASLAGTVRIDSLVELVQPIDFGLELECHHFSFPILKGRYGHPEKYAAFEQFSLSFLSYPDPFNPRALDSTPASANLVQLSTSTSQQGVQRREPPKRQPSSAPYKKREKDQPLNSGRDKFSEVPSELMPATHVTWVNALKNVERNTHPRVQPTTSSDSGYVFPEPGLLIGPSTPAKQTLYLLNWLRYRNALINRMVASSSTARPVSTQLWRTLLNLPLENEEGHISAAETSSKPTKGKKRLEIVQELLQECLETEEGVTISSMPIDLSWRGQPISIGCLPPMKIIHDILWELSELNFRFELVALDRRAAIAPINSTARKTLIAKCFPGVEHGSMLVADFGRAHCGLAASSWEERAPFVLSLRKVMETWRGFDSASFGSTKELGYLSEAEFEVIETVVARFYTQSFFDFFGRAAVLPRRLAPSDSVL